MLAQFRDHPIVRDKLCVRRPGVGFQYQGRRLSGITAFLALNYFPQFKAFRRPTFGAFKHRDKNLGLRVGTKVDTAITAYIKSGQRRKMPTNPKVQRLIRFVTTRLNLTLVDAHVLICEPNLGIATEIDVLCTTANGSLVVIENKTTLQTRAEHEATYKKPDAKHPHMRGHFHSFLNNEYNHQMAQLAFMLVMLEFTYGIVATGHVLMASVDGLNHYPMNPFILAQARAVFTIHRSFGRVLVHPTPNQALISYNYRFSLPTSPVLPDQLPPVLVRFLAKMQLPKMPTRHHKVGSFAFFERPDLITDAIADLYAEDADTIYIFCCRTADGDIQQCAEIEQPPTKLASGHPASPLNRWLLELAIVTHAVVQTTPRRKISARLLLLGPKPTLRVLPPRLLAALK